MTQPALTLPPRKPRQRVLKGALVLTDADSTEVSCIVRNMHSEGAELHLPVGADVPEQFLLYLPFERKTYIAVLRWRDGARAGVQFKADDSTMD